MKTSVALFSLLFCFALSLRAQGPDPYKVLVVPHPLEMNLKTGSFPIAEGIGVLAGEGVGQEVVNHFMQLIKDSTGVALRASRDATAKILFTLRPELPPEAYELHIAPKEMEVIANDGAGFFYALQSLRQLFQKEKKANKTQWHLPALSIKDRPRFGWRAYMLDEARYFQGAEVVKRLLDQMALLKMNVFHWHLTDDAGWRVEIKKYPKLTEIGAHRADSEIGTWKSGKLAGVPHSGFYTQEEIRDIVAYAAQRHITVVPEFEMPGHASAAIASYTWLGSAGKDIEVPILFGRHYDNYDVTKPRVHQYIKDVLQELFALFPSEVIHIGGDEVGYKVWEETPHVQDYMEQNGIKSPADLQVRFTNEISNYMASNGRRMMGWNEILGVNVHTDFEEKKNDVAAETELAKNVVVHFWKGGLDLMKQAAKKGYGIVNSLHSSTYLDYSHTNISLEKAYHFNPIPEGLEAKYHQNIYGLGCQMWGEWTPTRKEVEHQTFPRIAAYAEVGWSAPAQKDYERFKKGLAKLQGHWRAMGIGYAKVLEAQ
ncbi:beta-N-acetylhexosaminidase [Maribacter sp. 2307ULW6-5]|uniref:beta-N-acetylhexosaminidase n=1 Tax=Maribacter sp. 2307ULW6-5 TaxID=3386275 RepID=UPI0039BD3B89